MTELTAPDTTGRPSRATLALFFAGVFVFLYLRTFLLPGTPFVATGDEVQFFMRAVRIVHGQVPFRDFIVIVPPGTELMYASAFRVFGIHAWVVQAWGIVTGLALCGVITSIAGKILRGWMVLLPALLFLVFDLSSGFDMTHHWYSTLAALCAARVLMGGRDLRRIFAAGMLCAVATLFTQTQGAMAVVAVAVYLVWRGRVEKERHGVLAQLATFVLPYLLVLSGFLGYYIHEAGFHEVFFDLVQFAPRYMTTGEGNTPLTYLHQFPTIHGMGDLIRIVPFLFIYAMVPYVYFVGLYQIWRRRDELPATLLQRLVLLHLIGLGLLLAVVHAPRFFRLTTVAAPAILICVWLLSEGGEGRKVARNLLCGVAMAAGLFLILQRQVKWHAVMDLPIGRVAFNDKLLYREFRWVAPRTHPGETIFDGMPLCLYLSLRNPTALEFVSDTEFTRPERVAVAIKRFREDPPQFVVLEVEGNPADVHDHTGPMREYVRENYRLTQVFVLKAAAQYEEEFWELDPKMGK